MAHPGHSINKPVKFQICCNTPAQLIFVYLLTVYLTMTRLVAKIQYKNFEAGEFIDVQERDYEETIALIGEFPWHTQREKIVIGLTNPAVTIEGKHNNFLKLAVFFNQKYVLHYFDKNQVVYTRSVLDLADGYVYIKRFFEQPEFVPDDFKKENTWLQHNLKHFVTQDFRYITSRKSVIKYLLVTSGMNFCFSVVMLTVIFLKGFHTINALGLTALLLAIFVVGGGSQFLLFFNYYNHVKNKILILSKGNDSFWFGDKRNPLHYNKKDILYYTTIRMGGSRGLYNGFAIVEITLRDGTVLKIPNLLLDDIMLAQKLFEYPGTEKNELPYLRTRRKNKIWG
jgi:hypothetical protein